MAPRGRGPAGLDRGGRAEANSSLRERLRDYESLLESLGGIVWEADPETLRFRFVSRQAERLLGYPVELWLKTPNFWIDHVHPDDRAWVPDFCRDATAAHRSHELDYRMIAADGSVVWLRDIVTVVIEEGRPVSCRGVMIDIRERKRAEAELRVATERLRTLVHNAPVILFGVDRHGTVELCEGKGLEAAGIDPSEIVGRHFADWPRSTGETQQNIRRALAGEDFTATVSFEDRAYVTRYAPIRAPRGGTDGVMGVATDVTESLVRVIKADCADFVKFGVTQAGGLLRAAHMLATAEAAGIPVVLGHGFGLDPSTMTEVMLAATSRNVVAGLECVGPLKVVDTVATTRLDIGSGSIALPPGPGLGIVLDDAKLEQYRLDASA